mgnify:CR=1 FL=1
MKKSTRYVPWLFLMLLTNSLVALDIEVTNSVEDMITNKKIWLHLAFNPEEEGIFKRSLQFSVDQPDMLLRAWHPLVQWRPLFLPSFKKIKRMITNSFAGWLAIDFAVPDEAFARHMITQTRMQVSCLVLYKNGITAPVTVNFLVDKSGALRARADQSIDRPEAQKQHLCFTPEIRVSRVRMPVTALDSEFEMYEPLGRAWASLMHIVRSMAQLKTMVIALLLLGFLVGLFSVRRRYWPGYGRFLLSAYWEHEMRELFALLLIGSFVYFVIPLASQMYAFYVGSLFCFVAMLYIFIKTPNQSMLWLRLKSLVGFGMGVLVLPLLLKGYLLQCGL